MGSVGDCFDNSVVQSLFETLQAELLDQGGWETRARLAAVFEWIEAWSTLVAVHSYCSMLSPVDYEATHRAQPLATAA